MEAENQSIGQTPRPMMKQPVGKNKNLLLIIILAVLAVGGIGFGGFELWQNMQKDSEIVNYRNRFGSIEQEENTKLSNSDDEESRILESTNSVGFESFSASLLNKIKSLDESVQFYKQETRSLPWSEKQFRVTIDKDANLVLIWNNYKNEKVLANDVIDFEFVEFGNGGGDTYLYYINKDGSVSKTEDLQNIEDNEPAITDNVGGFKEIISIQTTHGNYPYGADGFYACFTNFNGNILFE